MSFGTGNGDTTTVTVTRSQKRFTSWTNDVLVSTTVLNLFEYGAAPVCPPTPPDS